MMEIGPLSNKPIGSAAKNGARPEPQRPEPIGTRRIRDQVEISDNARAQLAERADNELKNQTRKADLSANGGTIEEDKLAMIRRKIESGFYDDPDVRRQIAERIVDDLDS
jgi:hypothetical protein